jgi:hypothetical protein
MLDGLKSVGWEDVGDAVTMVGREDVGDAVVLVAWLVATIVMSFGSSVSVMTVERVGVVETSVVVLGTASIYTLHLLASRRNGHKRNIWQFPFFHP